MTKAIFTGVLAGVIAAVCIKLAGVIFYSEIPVLNLVAQQSTEKIIFLLPIGAQILIVLAWALGSFITGIVSTVYCKAKSMVSPLLAGVLMTLVATFTLFVIPHPEWMTISGVFLPVLFTLGGHRLLSNSAVRVNSRL